MILTTDTYADDEPGGRKSSKSQYTSKKEMLIIIAILIVLGIASTPLYRNFRDQADKTACGTNMKSIQQAMMQYAVVNDDQLPPIYHVGENDAPYLSGPDNKPYVWASLIQPYISQRASFECPAAEDDEKMPTLGGGGLNGDDFLLTYGMYLPMSAKPYMSLSRPQGTVLLAETSNFGAQGSYNPTPFYDIDGDVVPYDAFLIGYNDSNFGYSDETEWVTRLAFRNASNGYGSLGVEPRHKAGIYVFFIDGHRQMLQPAGAEVQNLYPDLDGIWRDR